MVLERWLILNKKRSMYNTHILKILKDINTLRPYLFSINNVPMKQHCLKKLDFLSKNSRK